ncbi:MAG: RNA 2',3'-cyclic phosphodiesterase [Stappiaceae bacterium]
MPRLFTGLEVPSQTGLMLSLLRGGLRGARWIDTENYHITLRFIGDIDDRTADEIAHALERVNRNPIEIQIRGLDVFGGNRPHCLIAKIEHNQALSELQAELERILQRLGLPPERRKYTPHITLARLRGTTSIEVADWLSQRGEFNAPGYVAGRFVLFSAKASIGGGPYLVEEAYPLAA